MKTNTATQPIVEDIDWGTIEGGNTDFEVKYPRMNWIHGSKQASGFMKTGGLFIAEEDYPNFNAGGFQPTTLITREGKEIEGFAAAAARLAVIRIKHQWIKDETYGKNLPLAHALCVVQGCEDLICISLRGPSKALEFQKAFQHHIAQNVATANRTRPQNAAALEPFALWFPIVAGEQTTVTSKDGKANSPVTLPSLAQPVSLDRDYVLTLWVGKDNYKLFAGYFRETANWQKTPILEQRDGNADLAPPEYSGIDDTEPASIQQIEHLAGICTAKGLNERDVMLDSSRGEYESFRQLTKGDARFLIAELAKQ